jgi:hypothetical protein
VTRSSPFNRRSAAVAFFMGCAAQLQAQALLPKTAHCTFDARSAYSSAASRGWLFLCIGPSYLSRQLSVSGTDVGCWYRGQVPNPAPMDVMALFFHKPGMPAPPAGGWALEQSIVSGPPPASSVVAALPPQGMIHRRISLVPGDSSQVWMVKQITLRRAPGNCALALQQAFP